MYSMNDVEELFGAGTVKIKFRKSIHPLSVFKDVDPERGLGRFGLCVDGELGFSSV